MNYKNYTNDQIKELVLKAQGGDEKSRDTILLAYYPLAKALGVKYRNNAVHEDDATSVAWIACNKAIDKYTTNTKASFTTFVSTCMRNAIFDLLRKENKFTENTVDDGDDIISQMDDMDALESMPTNEEFDDELMRLVMEELDKLFTKDEQYIIKLHLMKKKINEICAKAQKTTDEVKKVIRKYNRKLSDIRKKLKNL